VPDEQSYVEILTLNQVAAEVIGMRTTIRVIIMLIGGFFLMWPVADLYRLLHWPIFS
jgi:hypothetical protein